MSPNSKSPSKVGSVKCCKARAASSSSSSKTKLSASKGQALITEPTVATTTAPRPPFGARTVKHLVTQLEGQMARHSGYMPQKAVATALLVQHHKQSNNSNNKQGVAVNVVPVRSRLVMPWNKSKQRATATASTTTKKVKRPAMVRLLPEEW